MEEEGEEWEKNSPSYFVTNAWTFFPQHNAITPRQIRPNTTANNDTVQEKHIKTLQPKLISTFYHS